MPEKIIGPRGERTYGVLLNGNATKLNSKYYTHRFTLLSSSGQRSLISPSG